MLRLYNIILVALACQFVPAVTAQASAYGQCGGMGWTGATACVSGWTCVYSNPYYSQCQQATGSSTSTATQSTTTSKTTTTVSTTKTSTSTSATATSTSGTSYWFSFGDSYTDTGFYYGGTQPAPGNPLGNPAYPGNTFAGGPTWIDIATTISNHSLVLTWNYAVSGATVDKSVVSTWSTDLVTEVQNFVTWNSGSLKQPWTAKNSIFSFWFGINDIGNSVMNSPATTTPAAMNGDIIYHYFLQVQNLYNLGARNFLFINVPPMERSPQVLATSSSIQMAEKSMILDFNTKLSAAVSAFKANHTGVTTWIWDSHTVFNTILDNPKAYGFPDATSSGSATQDFWGNAYHPSGAAHTIFGKDIGDLLAGTPF